MDYEDWIKQKNDIANQLTNLRAAYINLAMKYRALSLQLRRDVFLPHAQERFECAAIFQDYPFTSKAGGNSAGSTPKGEADEALPANEECPVSRGWHSDLDTADVEMVLFGRKGPKSEDLTTVKQLVGRAETSLYHAEVLLKAINIQLPLQQNARSHVHIIKAWNRLCEELRGGRDFETALSNATFLTGGPESDMFKLRANTYTRTWFSCELVVPNEPAPDAWLAQFRSDSMPPPETPCFSGSQTRPQDSNPPQTPFNALPQLRTTDASSNAGGIPASKPSSSRSSTEHPAASFGFDQGSANTQSGSWGTFTGFSFNNSPWSYGSNRGAFSGGDTYQSPYGNRTYQSGHRPQPGYATFNETNYDAGQNHSSFHPHLYGPDSTSYYPPPRPNPFTSGGGDAFPSRGYAPPPASFAQPAPVIDRFAEQKERLQKYNARWEALSPSASHRTIPFPSRTLNMSTLAERSSHGLSQQSVASWTAEDHVKVNVSKFWADGYGVETRVLGSKKTVEIQRTNDNETLKVLRKQLRMKEASPWHPDTLNRRTGDEAGGTDESIGKMKEMKAIWGTLQDLLEQVEKVLAEG